MIKISVIQKLGKELTKKELEVINAYRKKEFNSKSIIDPKPTNDEWNKRYFLVKGGKANKLLSFGCFHNVTVSYKDEKYDVLGIARIVSVEKSKGYGRALLDDMRRYMIENNKIGVGFCNPNTSEFFKKSSFFIAKNAQNRFVYKDGDKEIKPKWETGDVIVFDTTKQLLSNLLNTNKVFTISRSHW